MDPFWYKSPAILLRRPREFWPSPQMSTEERLNAVTRFVLYAAVLLSVYRNDPSILAAGLAIGAFLAIIYVYRAPRAPRAPLQPAHTKPTTENMTDKECTRPTRHNPFANVSMADYEGNADRPSACYHETVADDIDGHFYAKRGRQYHDPFNRRHDQRQFFSNPTTTIPNDSVGFATWLYGKGGTCKSDHTTCTGTEAGMRSGGGVS